MPERDTTPKAMYEARRADFVDRLAVAARRSKTIGRGRVGIFAVVGAEVLLFESASPTVRMAFVVLAAILAVAFLVLVSAHGRARERERWLEMRVQLCDEGIRRIERRWADLPDLGPAPRRAPPFVGDLDLFGAASLSRLLGSVTTTPGQEALRSWLLEAPPPGRTAERQVAVEELSHAQDLTETLGAWGRVTGTPTPEALGDLLQWAESDASPLPRWARLASWILPPLTIGLGLASLIGWIEAAYWMLPAAASVGASVRVSPRLYETFRKISSGEVGLEAYARLFSPIADHAFEAPLLVEAGTRLSAGGVSAPAQVAHLGRLVHLSDSWRNPMVHWPLQVLTLWDFHIAARLDAWRSVSGTHVRDWVRALGEVDALGGLGTLRFENPSWTYPTLSDVDRVECRRVVHPYLSADVAVANDVVVGPPGSFLLVTGSNMSGKSTLLRAIGVNAVLARMGGPVAAESMVLPPVVLETSMRVQDSLEEGVSFFMAELQSLKRVVDAARDPSGGPVLYLLDEILQGTNTAERQIAARNVIRHLLDANAIGAVTSHDLHLADAPDLADRSRPVHFTETVVRDGGAPTLTFDYALRPGLATSTNALALMELVGLEMTPTVNPTIDPAPDTEEP